MLNWFVFYSELDIFLSETKTEKKIKWDYHEILLFENKIKNCFRQRERFYFWCSKYNLGYDFWYKALHDHDYFWLVVLHLYGIVKIMF